MRTIDYYDPSITHISVASCFTESEEQFTIDANPKFDHLNSRKANLLVCVSATA